MSNDDISASFVFYSGEVTSLRTSDHEIVSQGKCLSISDASRRKLTDGDKIRYKVNISQLANSEQIIFFLAETE